MPADLPPQGSKRALNYSPSRSPANMRFYGLPSRKQQRSSAASKKPPEPLRRAVADCLCSAAPNLHGNPSSLSSEAAKILREYLASPTTVDMAYNVLLEHAIAERDRSPAVVPRCISLLKHYLLRYVPQAQTLQHIDLFCENSIIECESLSNKRVSLWSKSLSRHSRASVATSSASSTLIPTSNIASVSLVKSLNYVRSLVARHIPKLSFQPLGMSGPSTSGKQSLPTLSSLLGKTFSSHLNSETGQSGESPQINESFVQSSLNLSNLDRLESRDGNKYMCPDLLTWRVREQQPSCSLRESNPIMKTQDLHANEFLDVGAAALLIDHKDAKLNDMSWKCPITQDLPDVDHILQTSSAATATSFASGHSHLKAITASKRMRPGPNQFWAHIPVSNFHPRAHPLFQYRHYSEQQPLRLNTIEISEVIAEACSESSATNVNFTMSSPLTNHNARPVAEVAVSVLIKLIIDMFLMDSTSAVPLTLSMLEDMLNSQKVASRVRVFDLFLNLGVHAQLLEPVLLEHTPAIAEEETSEEPGLNKESLPTAGISSADISIQRRMIAAIENFEAWLLAILFEVLLLLVQTEEREESVWASALSCLFYFVCDRGKILKSKLKGLDIRVIKGLLKASRDHSWAQVVHCKLICMLTNMFYDNPEEFLEDVAESPRFLVEQVHLLEGIDFVCLEYSQANSREEKRNLFLVLFDYALHQINGSCLAAGGSAYSFHEVQVVISLFDLVNAPEAYYVAVKHGVEDVGRFLEKYLLGALCKSHNNERVDLLLDNMATKLDAIIGAFNNLDEEFSYMIRETKSYGFRNILDELGETESLSAKFSWATLHSLLHSERAACRYQGYIWLIELLLSQISDEKGKSIWANIESFEQQVGVAGSQNLTISTVPLPISIMCGLLKSKHNFIRGGFLFVLDRILLRCKLLLDEVEWQCTTNEAIDIDDNQSKLQKANTVIDIMSSTLSLVVQLNETDHLNILKMCHILFSHLCVRLPIATGPTSGDPKYLDHPVNYANESCEGGSESYFTPKEDICNDKLARIIISNADNTVVPETSSMAALLLAGHAIVPMQLVARVPVPLFFWPLIQLAGAAADDIALGVAVGSNGRANLPGSTSDIRAALLLLLIGKCTVDSSAFQEVEGEEFFRGLLDDTDSRVAYYSAAFLLKRMMTEEPESYQRMLQCLIIKAQQSNNEKLLENPYLQMRGILQLVNDSGA
ncbi:hypothetical protein AXF42_Ash019088 [Apostasia shenzhenica]|uniref:Uncharacterized protein n=1 Tax=Apostasia shenzhenica TaxID=1088818 RepID=A0A2I0AA81_9ASPA|nr:hypothetical protein AXF42_Ash019088 [Apostasia shenzhenica]